MWESFHLGYLDYYLIGVNILCFSLFLINSWLYNNTADKQIDTVITVVAIAGGALGIGLAILITRQKAVKDNMMSRVSVWAALAIQIILFLIIKGHINSHINLKFWEFFAEHKWLLVYLIIINVVTIIAYGLDKIAAIRQDVKRRIAIVRLLGLAAIGGSLGALIGMYAFRHKTTKDYFTVGVPLIILAQAVMKVKV